MDKLPTLGVELSCPDCGGAHVLLPAPNGSMCSKIHCICGKVIEVGNEGDSNDQKEQ